MASDQPSLQDRFRGPLLGGDAVGDCIGRPVEGRRHVPKSCLIEALEDPHTLLDTDDTALTACVGGWVTR